MIIVTGANGQLGRAVAERLLDLVPAARIGVSVRDPEKARDLEGRGVRVRRGDFDDAASLAHAFEGASRVLIVSVDNLGEAAVRRHRAAIDAAKAAGAGRIFYTSQVAAGAEPIFYTSQVAAGAEPIFYTSHVGADPIPAFPPCSTMPRPKRRCGTRAWPTRRCATASTRRPRHSSSATPSKRAS